MSEQATANSYIVRVYRIDTEDGKKLTGLVEALDGSGERKPFTDLSELADLLKQGNRKRCGRRKRMGSAVV